MSTSALPVGFRPTKPRDPDQPAYTTTYAELMRAVKDAGLLRRAPGFYGSVFAGLTLALAGLAAAFIVIGDSWWQLLIAAALGIVLTQFAFLAHEASHRQVMSSGPANDAVGRVIATFVVGLSYQWWMTKHTRHHTHPNQIGKDPDIMVNAVSFYPEAAQAKTGGWGWLTRHQGSLFFPLLLLEGFSLHVNSVGSLFERRSIPGRATEIASVVVRFALYFVIVFSSLHLLLALAFIAVQMAIFGFYMGVSFAPNHKGMPIIPKDMTVDFFTRQVVTARNVSGGFPASMLMGGLNYQIEHHLFPNMARPYLPRARALVRSHCEAMNLTYTETTFVQSLGKVVRYLNSVGLSARDPFTCPVVWEYRVR